MPINYQNIPNQEFEIAILFTAVEWPGNYAFKEDNHTTQPSAQGSPKAYKVFMKKKP